MKIIKKHLFLFLAIFIFAFSVILNFLFRFLNIGYYLYMSLGIIPRNIIYILRILSGLSLFVYAFLQVRKYLKSRSKNSRYYPSFSIIFVVYVLVYTALSVVITGFIEEWDIGPAQIFGAIFVSLVFSCLYVYLYFLPYLIANKKAHPQTRAIYILNIFAGWTIIAWIIALIWANTEPKPQTFVQQTSLPSNADELKKYKDLLDGGVITQEEFEAKKKQLLGM